MNRFLSVSCALVATICLADSGVADDDPVSMVEMYSPDPGMINIATISAARSQIDWKIKRARATMETMNHQIKVLEDKITKKQSEIDELLKRHLGEYAHTSEDVRGQLLGRHLDQILSLRLDVAGYEGVLKLTEELNAKERMTQELKAREELETQMKSLQVEGQRLRALAENKAASNSELLKSNLMIRAIEAEILAIEAKQKSTKADHASSMAVAEMKQKLYEKQLRLKLAEKQLTEIRDASSVAKHIRRREREVERMNMLLDIREQRRQESMLAIEDFEAMLMLIDEGLKEAEKDTRRE